MDMRYLHGRRAGENEISGAWTDRTMSDVLMPTGIWYAFVTHGERAEGNGQMQQELVQHTLAKLRPKHVGVIVATKSSTTRRMTGCLRFFKTA